MASLSCDMFNLYSHVIRYCYNYINDWLLKVKFGKVTVVGRRKVDAVDEKYGVNLSEEEASGRLIQVEQGQW